MSSILNTDLGDLYSQWGERIAFNEGFQQQKIAEARQAGRDAFHMGVDRAQARDMFFAGQDQRVSEAREFLNGDSVKEISDSDVSDIESDTVDIEPIGEVTDGEETLGMESVVANETDDLVHQPIVDSSFDFWDKATPEQQESWLSNDMQEASYFDMWSEMDSDFNPNVAR